MGSLGEEIEQFTILPKNDVTSLVERKFLTQPRFRIGGLARDYFFRQKNENLFLLVRWELIDLFNDFGCTHINKLVHAIFGANSGFSGGAAGRAGFDVVGSG